MANHANNFHFDGTHTSCLPFLVISEGYKMAVSILTALEANNGSLQADLFGKLGRV